jgi:S-formylglutathione hydrolase
MLESGPAKAYFRTTGNQRGSSTSTRSPSRSTPSSRRRSSPCPWRRRRLMWLPPSLHSFGGHRSDAFADRERRSGSRASALFSTLPLVLLLLTLLPVAAGAQGSLHDDIIFSQSLGLDRSLGIYLPEGYDPASEAGYPVVYFLHGALNGYPGYWTNFQMRTSLDNMIGSGQIEPLIMVTPDGLIGPYAGSYWTNSDLYGPFEDYVCRDVVAYMDSTYCTMPTRDFRCIQGLSMGGYGAMKIGLKHPETYRALASHSGPNELFVDLEHRRPLMLAEYPSGPPYDFDPGAGTFSLLLFTQSGAYSPDVEAPPWFVDLPLDEWGEIIPSVMDRWRDNNPAHLASQLPPPPWEPDSDLDIFFDCGTLDQNQLYPGNCALAESLDALGIEHTFESFVGGHSDQFTLRFRVGVAHLDSVMWRKGELPSGAEPRNWSPGGGRVTIAPNPCSGPVEVRFQLPVQERPSVDVVDGSGRIVRSLLTGFAPAGPNSVEWCLDDHAGAPVPAGVYFVRVRPTRGPVAYGRAVVVR